MTDFKHQTVLLHETVDMLHLHDGDIAIDATAGGGGHTAELLRAVGANGRVIAMDRDPRAIAVINSRFSDETKKGRLIVVQEKFSQIAAVVANHQIGGKVAGICADLGVSSPQLDEADRGFSFAKDGPLSMRMDQDSGARSAADIVNTASESELSEIFRDFGEEPKARFVARAIVQSRAIKPITTTTQLAEIVAASIHYKEKSRKHPATKVFQALRIVVNQELEELDQLLVDGIAALKVGGHLGIISFHSLEDRRVKRYFASLTNTVPESIRRDAPLTDAELQARYPALAKEVRPYPCKPSDNEVENNPRSRSALLRVVEKK